MSVVAQNAVAVALDRTMRIRPDEIVKTAWIDIDCVRLGNRAPLAIGDVEAKLRALLQLGPDGSWPPPCGAWDGKSFVILDGRHEYVAALMLGRTRVFVAWREKS